MVKTIKRRRGRPPGSTKVPPDLLADIWIAVWLQRVSERIRTGKTPSVRQACHDLAARGGVISVVGGNQLALEGENVQRKKRWQRFQIDSTGASLTPQASGPIFASQFNKRRDVRGPVQRGRQTGEIRPKGTVVLDECWPAKAGSVP